MKDLEKLLTAEHFVFDFDGTLVNSMPRWRSCMSEVLRNAGVRYGDDILRIITPLGIPKTVDYFREVLHIPGTHEEIDKQIKDFLTYQYHNTIEAKEGVADFLKALKSHGKKIHVLTCSPHLWVEPCLKRNGILDLFDCIWSTDDFGLSKNEGEIYREAAKRLKTDISKMLFFDDNIGSVGGAKMAALPSIAVYDETSDELVDSIKELADSYVFSMSELIAPFEKANRPL